MCLRAFVMSRQFSRTSSKFSSILTFSKMPEKYIEARNHVGRYKFSDRCHKVKGKRNNGKTDHYEKFTRSKWDDEKVDEEGPHIPGSTLRWNPESDQWDISTPLSSTEVQNGRSSAKFSQTKPKCESSQNHLTGITKQKKSSANQHDRSYPNPKQFTFNKYGNKTHGKRQRKKEKLGFIEIEVELEEAEAEQVLYGLHPVQLALSASQRRVLHVYHRSDTGSRLSRVLSSCVSQGIPTTELPAAQLDRMAGGTGVHQGVCARVTPLRPVSVSNLLRATGYPPLDETPRKEGAGDADEADSEMVSYSVETADATQARVESSGGCGASSESEPRSRNLAGRRVDEKTHRPDDAATGGLSENLPSPGGKARRRRLWLLLDRVQDPMNFGSILRSSYFLGVDAVLIPDRNSCPLSPTVSKASAGVLEVFPVYSVPFGSCCQLLQLLRRHSWQLLAAGAGQRQENVCGDADTLLVVGNEGRGVDRQLAQLCRQVSIPAQRHLADGVESLNVGVATGILLSQLTLTRGPDASHDV